MVMDLDVGAEKEEIQTRPFVQMIGDSVRGHYFQASLKNELQQQMPGIGAKMFETDMTTDMSVTPDVSLNHTKACMKRCVA